MRRGLSRKGLAGLEGEEGRLGWARLDQAREKVRALGRGERRGGLGRLGCFAGLGWIAKGIGFSISYLKPNSTYLNSNLNLNSTLALKQIKQCTSMNATTSLNLEKF